MRSLTYLLVKKMDLLNRNDDVTDIDEQRNEHEMENVGMNHNDDATDIDGWAKETEMENVGMNDDATDINGPAKETEMENVWIDESDVIWVESSMICSESGVVQSESGVVQNESVDWSGVIWNGNDGSDVVFQSENVVNWIEGDVIED